jgi:predicted phosphoribosyltransferase
MNSSTTLLEGSSVPYWKPAAPVFESRRHAGELLAKALINQFGIEILKEAVVLGCPRGGMIFAEEVTIEIKKGGGIPQLDVIVSRKIPLPGTDDYAIGAVTEQGECIYMDDVVASKHLDVNSTEVELEAQKVKEEVKRRVYAFRQGQPITSLDGKVVVIVDGLVSGATLIACVKSVKNYFENIKRIIVATPLSTQKGRDRLAKLSGVSAENICTGIDVKPQPGCDWNSDDFYSEIEFKQMTDEHVRAIIQNNK